MIEKKIIKHFFNDFLNFSNSFEPFPLSFSGVISIEIRTSIPNGLIFYAADDRHIDMMTLYLDEGHVVFGFDAGSGLLYISSPNTVNDGEWHIVSVCTINIDQNDM